MYLIRPFCRVLRDRKNDLLFTVISIIFLLQHSTQLDAQQKAHIVSNTTFAEKIYLQTDRSTYTFGNTIWFKAIVLNAFDHKPSKLSGILHVELISPEESIVQKKRIRLHKGIGEGYIDINKEGKSDTYLIRAYTQWNENFNEGFIFKEYIRIESGDATMINQNPIQDVTVVNEADHKKYLRALLFPNRIDSLHSGKLKVILNIDGKKDTLKAIKYKNESYGIVYPISNEDHLVTVAIQTKNSKKFTKTITLKNKIDLQFLPESGKMLHGKTCKVGFKSLGENGLGKRIEGTIVDENDSVVSTFKSNALGMGCLHIKNASYKKDYFAHIKTDSTKHPITIYKLPKVARIGHHLSLIKKDSIYTIEATSNLLKEDSITLQLSYRGIAFYNIRLALLEGNTELIIPQKDLPEGIIVISLCNMEGTTLAQRLFFNPNANNRVEVTLTNNKYSYHKREETITSIESRTKQGHPLKANLSFLVIDNKSLASLQSNRQNICSYFLLNSELKGNIESPGFYFKPETKNQFKHLDALMLTQGWRNYNFSDPIEKLNHLPEYQLTVAGQVKPMFKFQKTKETILTLLSFGENPSVYYQQTDSCGQFSFNLQDEYGKTMDVLIESKKTSGEKKDFIIELNPSISPVISFKHRQAIENIDSTIQHLVQQEKELQKIRKAFPLSAGEILLDELEVEGYKLTPIRKEVMERFGEPDVVIEGDSIRKKETNWAHGLYAVLHASFPEKINIVRGNDGISYARHINGEMTIVVIDGIPIKAYDYEVIPHIPTSEVKSFEIIEYASDFLRLYCEVHPPSCAYGPTTGNVIAIYTYGGKGFSSVYQPKGMNIYSIPTLSPTREFYSPQYVKKESENKTIPDLRTVLHWEPVIETDSIGSASVSYFNDDVSGSKTIIVEAISQEGHIGYQTLEYIVEGKNKTIEYLIQE